MITDKQTADWARELALTEDEIERLRAEDKAARHELRLALWLGQWGRA